VRWAYGNQKSIPTTTQLDCILVGVDFVAENGGGVSRRLVVRTLVVQKSESRVVTGRGEQMTASYVEDTILLKMFQYWDRKRGDRPMPARRDIDPTEVPKLLPHIRLTEIREGCTRFRYRLVGTAVVDAYGADFTGKYTDELYSGERKVYVERNYHIIHERKRPIFLRSRYVTLKGYDIIANRLLAPLSDNGADVDMVIAALTFEFGSALPEVKMQSASLDSGANHIEIL
jgi:hypothetical protein